jgi:hypothetical protein
LSLGLGPAPTEGKLQGYDALPTDRLIAASIQWAEKIMEKIDKVFTQ